jgi:hypothetical protein
MIIKIRTNYKALILLVLATILTIVLASYASVQRESDRVYEFG